MRNIILILAAATFGFCLAAFPLGAEEAGTVKMVLGQVSIESGGASRPGAVNDRLQGGEIIVTGPDSMADILMGDRGYVRVGERTRVSIASLKKSGEESDLDLSLGSVMVFLNKLTRRGSYEAKGPTQVVAVRGTIFQMTGDEEGSRVDVLSGSVEVSPVVRGAVQRQISQLVAENQSLALSRARALQVLAGQRRLEAEAMRREIRDSIMKQVQEIRERPEFKRFGREMRKEIIDRIEKKKRELKEKGLDRESLKERMEQGRERLKQEGERLKDEGERMRKQLEEMKPE
ncbi:MAG: FecR domain-containing protein [Spirochaetes bacterium]|nr:FecR domain-containing protein [Spirochaetota bacterium]